MSAPVNTFKSRLKSGETLIGLWLTLGDPTVAELASHTGYDWLVVDGEHGPNELRDILDQLRAIGDRSEAVVRPSDDNRAGLKKILDLGAQTILVPMVESAEQAAEIVRSVHYPPSGVRGVGAAFARASAYGTQADYPATANDQICVLVQVESRAGLEALDAILAVEGVDGVFIGPSDLAADMGYLGQPTAPEVKTVIEAAIAKIRSAGKAPGILATEPALAQHYASLGVGFLAVGADTGVLRAGLQTLRANF